MSGAQLENAGQVRNIYPHMTNYETDTTLSITASGARDWTAAIAVPSRVPFDTGPDKPSRVFIVLSNLTALISHDAPASINMFGFLNYQAPDGRKHLIAGMALTPATGINTALNFDRIIVPLYSFNADALNNLGSLCYTAIVTGLGGGTAITMRCVVNIGLYGDYAEPEWNELFRMREHEHTGLPVEVVE